MPLVEQKHNAERHSESKPTQDAHSIVSFYISLGDHGLQRHGQDATTGKSSCHRFDLIRR